MRCTFGELLVRAGSGSTCSRVPAWEIVRLWGVVSVSDCSGSCLWLGEDPLAKGALRSGVLRRRFFAARDEQTAVATCPKQPRQLFFSLQGLAISTTASQTESSGSPSNRSAE
eukprot:8005315-Pyramimonas_sp.AAC.1